MIAENQFNQPILIVGAPRTGTKMLRELIKLHPMIVGALYEKERVWCYGNKDRINRSLEVNRLTEDIKRYIRNHFDLQSKKSGGKKIVDKNVTNTLRIEFIREVFPESPIIHIIRDGRDAAVSIRARWKSSADLNYIIRNKAFPIEELPFFLQRQIKLYLQKLFSSKNHVPWWGPQFDDMHKLTQTYSLIEICVIQWTRCTETAIDSLNHLDDSAFIQVRYEDIVLHPKDTMESIFRFLGFSVEPDLIESCMRYVRNTSIARWRQILTGEEKKLVMPLMQDTLKKLSYI